LLFAATVFTFTNATLILDLNSSLFLVPPAAGSVLASLSLIGLGMVVLSVFIDKWDSRRNWLLSYTVLMAILTFVIPISPSAAIG
jgi:MFS-type transporter involved in bile tolerance (Atg22 family)